MILYYYLQKYILYSILFLWITTIIYPQNSPPTTTNNTSMNFETWEKTLNFIHSSKKDERKWAIDTVIKFTDQRGIDLLKKRLLIESDNELLLYLLDIIYKRNSIDDYNDIIEFLKSQFRSTLGVQAFQFLYKLSPKKTIQQLPKLMRNKEFYSYFLLYLEAIPNPTEEEKIQCRDIFNTFNLGKIWIQISLHQESKIFDLLKPYYFDLFFLSKIQPSSLYWYLRYKNYYGEVIEPKYYQEINVYMLNDIPEYKQWSLLEMAQHILVDTMDLTEWYTNGSDLVKRWMVHTYLQARITGSSLRNSSSWDKIFTTLVQESDDPSLIQILNSYLFILSDNEKKEYCTIKTEKNRLFCFIGLLEISTEQAIQLWNTLTKHEKEESFLMIGDKILQVPYFQSKAYILELIDHTNENIRLKAIQSIQDTTLIPYFPLIYTHLLFENSKLVRGHLFYRIQTNPVLMNQYKYIEGLQ